MASLLFIRYRRFVWKLLLCVECIDKCSEERVVRVVLLQLKVKCPEKQKSKII